mgnify:CR=1 FL=1
MSNKVEPKVVKIWLSDGEEIEFTGSDVADTTYTEDLVGEVISWTRYFRDTGVDLASPCRIGMQTKEHDGTVHTYVFPTRD